MMKRKTYSLAAYSNGENVKTFKCASLKDARASVRNYLYYDLHLNENEINAVIETNSYDNGFIYSVNATNFVRILVA